MAPGHDVIYLSSRRPSKHPPGCLVTSAAFHLSNPAHFPQALLPELAREGGFALLSMTTVSHLDNQNGNPETLGVPS